LNSEKTDARFEKIKRKPLRVLITGCHGLLGQKLVALVPDHVDVFGIDLQEESPILPQPSFSKCDITDRQQVLEHVLKLAPDWIINAAAYTNVDGAEKERRLCWKVNVEAVENLAYAARKVHSKIVHISTDYIFDGKDGPYDENAVPNPLGYYGRSKLAGENALRVSSVEYIIIRTMILYGKNIFGNANFVTWLIEKLRQKQKVTIVTDQIGNTTLADELAGGIWKTIGTDYRGVLNIAGREILDRLTFARQVAQVFELDQSLITPITTDALNQAAPRPLNSGLLVDKAINEFHLELSDAKEGLVKLKEQFN